MRFRSEPLLQVSDLLGQLTFVVRRVVPGRPRPGRAPSPYRAAARKPAIVLLSHIAPAVQELAAGARTLTPYRATVQENRGFMARYGPKVRLAGTIRRTSTSYRAKRALQLVLLAHIVP